MYWVKETVSEYKIQVKPDCGQLAPRHQIPVNSPRTMRPKITRIPDVSARHAVPGQLSPRQDWTTQTQITQLLGVPLEGGDSDLVLFRSRVQTGWRENRVMREPGRTKDKTFLSLE